MRRNRNTYSTINVYKQYKLKTKIGSLKYNTRHVYVYTCRDVSELKSHPNLTP